jgi:hypothetical protein
MPRFNAPGFTAMAGLALLALAPLAHAEERHSAQVSVLDGEATETTAQGAKNKLAVNSTVYENDTIETSDGAKLELKMKDGSVVRLGPKSKLQLQSAYFGPGGEKKFSAKRLVGKVWSKVSGLLGGESKFEVETDNAVAGVRGTTFRVDASTDKSVLVRVYAGAVAMAPGAAIPRPEHDKHARKQIKGPQQVTAQAWEEIVGKMMQMTVAADGTPGKPTAFAAADDANDEWASWNTALDAK